MLKSPKIYNRLDQIRKIICARQVILAKRDGLPLQWAGNWYSIYELVNISYQVSLIYKNSKDFNSEGIKYTIIDGKRESSIIIPLQVKICCKISGMHKKVELICEKFLLFNHS